MPEDGEVGLLELHAGQEPRPGDESLLERIPRSGRTIAGFAWS
jgi:hypothetical protein